MNKKLPMGLVAATFMCSIFATSDHHTKSSVEDFAERLAGNVKVLDHALEQILLKGSPNGFAHIGNTDFEIVPSSNGSVVVMQQELDDAISFVNELITPLVKILKNRPAQKEKIATYILHFKNKIDLIHVMGSCIAYLVQMHQKALEQGHKKEALALKKTAHYIADVRTKWVDLSANTQKKMLENLFNSLNSF